MGGGEEKEKVVSRKPVKKPETTAAVTCRPRLPPGLMSARRIERSIMYAELG